MLQVEQWVARDHVAEWAAWEPVSAEPLDADCTSFVHELRPGLTYSFRLAALSDLN